MKCLRCENVELEVQVKGEGADVFEVDACKACSGVWLDADELGKLDDNLFVDVETIDYQPASASAEDAVITCPRCKVKMDKVHPGGFANTVLDNCPQCKGFWLDAGELEKMRDVSDQMLIKSLLD